MGLGSGLERVAYIVVSTRLPVWGIGFPTFPVLSQTREERYKEHNTKCSILWTAFSKELNPARNPEPLNNALGSGQLKQARVESPRVGQVVVWPACFPALARTVGLGLGCGNLAARGFRRSHSDNPGGFRVWGFGVIASRRGCFQPSCVLNPGSQSP